MRARLIIAALSLTVVAAVTAVLALAPGKALTTESTLLPRINASLNGAAAILLTAGWMFVKRRRIRAHRACMLAAFAASSLFLVTYLLHHAQVGSVPYQGTGALRVVYFTLLIPHIVLAAAVVPLALFALYRALIGNYAAHKRIARIALPIWLYVSVSGVLVFAMLYGG